MNVDKQMKKRVLMWVFMAQVQMVGPMKDATRRLGDFGVMDDALLLPLGPKKEAPAVFGLPPLGKPSNNDTTQSCRPC